MVCTDWRPAAAYFYLLHLDGPSLAWEYLRRNSNYQTAWRNARHAADGADHWGLLWFEDPMLDARVAQPAWVHDPAGLTRIAGDPDPTAVRFDLWRWPGRKRLTHDGRRLLLLDQLGHHKLRIEIDKQLCDGDCFCYRLHSDCRSAESWQSIQKQQRWLALPSNRTTFLKTERIAWMHANCIQAIDGERDGASLKEIANYIFGETKVGTRLQRDSAMRARIRHLIKRGREFLNGGYRPLLTTDR